MTDEQWLRLVELQNVTIEAQNRTITVLFSLAERLGKGITTDLAQLRVEFTQRMGMANETLDRLEREVAENSDVVQSAITLIGGLAQQIRDAGTDQAKLNELTDRLDSGSAALAAAIAANTPAESASV